MTITKYVIFRTEVEQYLNTASSIKIAKLLDLPKNLQDKIRNDCNSPSKLIEFLEERDLFGESYTQLESFVEALNVIGRKDIVDIVCRRQISINRKVEEADCGTGDALPRHRTQVSEQKQSPTYLQDAMRKDDGVSKTMPQTKEQRGRHFNPKDFAGNDDGVSQTMPQTKEQRERHFKPKDFAGNGTTVYLMCGLVLVLFTSLFMNIQGFVVEILICLSALAAFVGIRTFQKKFEEIQHKNELLKNIRLIYKKKFNSIRLGRFSRMVLIDGIFTDIYITESLESTLESVKRPLKTYSEIFRVLGTRFVLVGEPGSGKTTLCSKLALDWAKNIEFQNVDILLIIHLRYLNNVPSIGEAIKRFCLQRDVEVSSHDIEEILKKMKNKAFIIFDGLDELPKTDSTNHSACQDVIDVLNGDKFPDARVLVTTREHGLSSVRGAKFDSRLDLYGFSLEKAREYIKTKAFKNDPIRSERAIHCFHKSGVDEELGKNPLLLTLFCEFIRREGKVEVSPMTYTYTSLFNKLANCIVHHHNEKNPHRPITIHSLGQMLGNVAFCGVRDGQLVWSKRVFKTQVTNKSYLLCVESGFIVEHSDMYIPNTDDKMYIDELNDKGEGDDLYTVEFIHKTFQEYMSAVWVGAYIDIHSALSFVDNFDTVGEVGLFLKFLCGMSEKAAILVLSLLPVLQSAQLAVECFYECVNSFHMSAYSQELLGICKNMNRHFDVDNCYRQRAVISFIKFVTYQKFMSPISVNISGIDKVYINELLSSGVDVIQKIFIHRLAGSSLTEMPDIPSLRDIHFNFCHLTLQDVTKLFSWAHQQDNLRMINFNTNNGLFPLEASSFLQSIQSSNKMRVFLRSGNKHYELDLNAKSWHKIQKRYYWKELTALTSTEN